MFSKFFQSILDNTGDVSFEVLFNCEIGVPYEIINREFLKANGEYVVLMCDDCVVHPGWARNMIDFMKTQPPLTVGGFKIFSKNREDLKEISKITYFNHVCSIFPFVRREETLSKFGYFFDSGLKRFYGDIDLSLRFISQGGHIRFCDNSVITMFSNRDDIKKASIAKYWDADDKYFNHKWSGHDFSLHGNKTTAGALQETMLDGSISGR